ncbi:MULTISPECIES: DUF6686 family protein [Bacteroidota]|jgi:hypothetical protein|uniref:Uncharacterized protein n=1 Tax=Flectobacillus rivi TaxID=2984209 RepID=A0ABT6Z7W5_9BACT|nr:DUF6686 family protein [Flectobacillus rivi]MDI9877230.1 hypothetical protein [Flectobacillus rivi]
MRHQEHQTQSILEKENAFVSHCTCCNQYNLSYKNLLFALSLAELRQFKAVMEEKIGFYEYPSSHGKELLFKTPLQHFFLLFSEAEILELCDFITEALLVIEARFILSNSQIDE